MNPEIRADLLRVATLLEPPGAWTQGCYAKDKHGNSVDPESPEARCWCARGAVYAVVPAERYIVVLQAMVAVGVSVSWNDTPGRTQAEVVALVRRSTEGT